MKTTNKGFTIVELLVSLVIIAIVLAMVAAFMNIFKFLFWVLVYFSIPGIIFGVILKLNQKYKWVVKGKYDRYIANFIDVEYPGGRHYPLSSFFWNDGPPKVECYPTNNALILWYGYCPINENTLKRKAQIKHRIPQSDREKGAGYHHFFDEEQFKSIVTQFALPNVRCYKEEISKYYNFTT